MRRNLAGLLVGLLGSALLLWATAAACRATDLAELDAFRRLWSDMAVGIDAYLAARAPLAPDAEPSYAGPDGLDAERTYRRLVVSGARSQDIRPWQFWRTLPERPFRRLRLEPVPKHYDDHGRGHLLGLGFRLLGGIAPFLVVWLGALCCVPVVLWAAWDLVRAGLPAAAAAFVALLGVSCFWVESLALTRYAVGFYLVGLLLIVPLAAYAVSPTPSQRGLLVRAVLGGALFALAAACRSSVGLLLPGILFALTLGVGRLAGSRLRRGVLLLALSRPSSCRSRSCAGRSRATCGSRCGRAWAISTARRATPGPTRLRSRPCVPRAAGSCGPRAASGSSRSASCGTWPRIPAGTRRSWRSASRRSCCKRSCGRGRRATGTPWPERRRRTRA